MEVILGCGPAKSFLQAVKNQWWPRQHDWTRFSIWSAPHTSLYFLQHIEPSPYFNLYITCNIYMTNQSVQTCWWLKTSSCSCRTTLLTRTQERTLHSQLSTHPFVHNFPLLHLCSCFFLSFPFTSYLFLPLSPPLSTCHISQLGRIQFC